jgi:glycerophosphoryl diester phosphodiesterase
MKFLVLIKESILLSCLLSCIFLGGHALASPMEVRAHRGGSAHGPENLLSTLETAIRQGSDSIEFDIHFTADDGIVLSHDPTLSRRCLIPGTNVAAPKKPIIQMKLTEVQSYDCGSLPTEEFPSQKLSPVEPTPTLDAVFTLLNNKLVPNSHRTLMAIEIKISPAHPEYTPARRKLARLLIRHLKKHAIAHRAKIISFDSRILKEIHRVDPAIPLEFLVGDRHNYAKLQLAKSDLLPIVDAILPHKELVTALSIGYFHKKGKKVIPWTVNDSLEWLKLKKLGVDGITTDDPLGLMELLRKTGSPF